MTWFSGAPCAAGTTCVRIAADGAIPTSYIRLLGFDTLKVSASGTAQRTPIVMSLVLDKSGSMNFNGGAAALPPAVINFTNHFAVGIDHLSEISFSSIAFGGCINDDVVRVSDHRFRRAHEIRGRHLRSGRIARWVR